ncbi:MAG TPA: hypothetical protein PKD61_17095 [Polyangiaceae bacterium]|nr:hypothetical protein [Polyangiaceae bacterium]
MHVPNPFAAVALVSVLVFCAGCSSDDAAAASGGAGGTGGGNAGAGGTGGGSGGAGGGGPTISYSGTFTEFALIGTGAPLADAEFCVLEHPEIPCVKTGADGKYLLDGVPANAELAITATKAGFQGNLVLAVSGDVDQVVDGFMINNSLAQIVYAGSGFSWPLNNEGSLLAGVFHKVPKAGPADAGAGDASASDGGSADAGGAGAGGADAGTKNEGLDGATFSVTPASGKGPVYLSAGGTPDQGATETSTQGFSLFGNLPPGEYEVTVNHPTKNCGIDLLGWPGSKKNAARVRVQPDFIAAATFICE